ncbi:hypothetical protein ACGFIP_32260 [Micromonospora zamorensis]|uniref:hypothetical protein n=1 Tax=Micromonospora zamorensis TaxID=709883 RepID=UPI003719A5D8
MTSPDPTIANLQRRSAEHRAAGQLAEAQRVDQLVIAVETLGRLADDRAEAVERGDQDAVATIDAQAQYWVRQVDPEELGAATAPHLAPEADPERTDVPSDDQARARKPKGK